MDEPEAATRKSAIDMPALTTERLTLQPLSRAHSQGMFALWSRPEVCRYSGQAHDVHGDLITLPAVAPRDSDKIIDVFVRGALDGTRLRWALVTKADGAFAGAAGFNALGTCSEYAYHLRPPFWGRGLMAEASRAAIDWLKRRPESASVEAFIAPANVASIKLAERLGFSPTGEVSHGADRYMLPLAGFAGR